MVNFIQLYKYIFASPDESKCYMHIGSHDYSRSQAYAYMSVLFESKMEGMTYRKERKDERGYWWLVERLPVDL